MLLKYLSMTVSSTGRPLQSTSYSFFCSSILLFQDLAFQLLVYILLSYLEHFYSLLSLRSHSKSY